MVEQNRKKDLTQQLRVLPVIVVTPSDDQLRVSFFFSKASKHQTLEKGSRVAKTVDRDQTGT